MTEETTQVHTTSQEAEPTQPDVVEELDQSTSETVEVEDGKDPSEQQEGKDPNAWALKRINALTAQKHESEREVQAMKAQAEQYRLMIEKMRNGDDVEAPQGQQPNIDELVNARAAEMSNQKAIQARGLSVSEQGEKAFPDFMQAAQTLDALGITTEQVHAVLGFDDAHKIIYAMGKNPEEAERILSLPPMQQGRELERLAGKPIVAPVKAVSKAPAPITPVDGTAPGEADPSKMSMSEWAKWREKTAKTRF